MKIKDYHEKNRWSWWYLLYRDLWHWFFGGCRFKWQEDEDGFMFKGCYCGNIIDIRNGRRRYYNE